MNFAIRDDDLNFFYSPDFMEFNLGEIFEICPVSMSAIPLVKGNWKKNTELLENAGPIGLTSSMVQLIQSDDTVFPIDLNKDLNGYIRDKVNSNKICIAVHGIHHRNEDAILPNLANNFSIGAEFNTSRNLTQGLRNAVQLLETCYGERVTVFTPPQNSYSYEGAMAVFENNLNICGYLPSIRNWKVFVNLFGLSNYFKYLRHRAKCKQLGIDYPFPHIIRNGTHAILDHCALQPTTCPRVLLEKLRRVRDEGGDFVLSTHSYAFDYLMKDSRKTMKQCLLEILNEVSKLSDLRFVTLNNLFKE